MNNLHERLERLERQNTKLELQNTTLQKGYKRMKLLGSLALVLGVGATMFAAGGERADWIWYGENFTVNANDDISLNSNGVISSAADDILLGDSETDWIEVQARYIVIDAWDNLQIDVSDFVSIATSGNLNLESNTDVIVRDLNDGSSFSLNDLKDQVDALQIQLDNCCGAMACPSDLDGNGTVQVADLLELIAAWGPCS